MKPKAKPGSAKAKTKSAARTRREPAPSQAAAPPESAAPPPQPRRRSVGKRLTAAIAETAKKILKPRRAVSRRRNPEPPPILLEGDHPAAPPVAGPGEKFSLGPTPVTQTFREPEGELPEAYGTKKLFLAARDPHWLYAHWDLTREQQAELNARSADGHLVLRIYRDNVEGHPLYEIHVHPDSRHWFAHVEHAGDSYAAELGYYSSVGRWMRVAVSAATITPPDTAAAETEPEFATIPFEFPFARLMDIIKSAVGENLPLARAIEALRRTGHPDLPRATAEPPVQWTSQQQQALARIVSLDASRRVWVGSLEITELVRRKLAREMASLGVSSLGLSSPTSPWGGGVEKGKEFWFNVNAELIVYGATEPNARVTLGGREIKLRPDGTFSYRFALPDGKYDLPAVAVSADGTDARAANLKFSRSTEYLGDVGASPSDPALQPPLPENV
ncbi:MAG TPA: DUF4912 domain-containing protein [Verrucomicrobiae bacterium]|nr:DUF4912 domain-containing protein [Verrucomicrobiae bacterium]